MGVKINGTDLADLGVGMTSISGWADGPRESRSSTDTAGMFGPRQGATKTVDARTLSVEGLIKGTTVEGRHPVLDAALSHMRGTCEIVPDDQPARVAVGELQRTRVTALNDLLVFARGVIQVRWDFVCWEALFRDLHAQIASFDSTARPVPMGTGPHRGLVTVTGVSAGAKLVVRDFRGKEVASMTFTSALAADEAYIVDLYRHRLLLSDSGAESFADVEISAGGFWTFSATWANPSDEAWPTMEIDSGEGYLTYYRRWLS